MNRIDRAFKDMRARGAKAFVAYIVAGDPSLQSTAMIAWALDEAGADILELGIPFSDPLADGKVNQLGSQRALYAGASVRGVLDIVRQIRTRSQIPIVLFTYYNPVFHYGTHAFAAEAEALGVDGCLLLDLPPEEAASEWPKTSGLRRISLIAPTTPPERIRSIARASSGFIYYVSREGVTGMQRNLAAGIETQVELVRSMTELPVCVGFGISSAEQAARVARIADGVVVGSAIVDRIGALGNAPDMPRQIAHFVEPLIEATHCL
jgi:tryptophan synthase alpha chain